MGKFRTNIWTCFPFPTSKLRGPPTAVLLPCKLPAHEVEFMRRKRPSKDRSKSSKTMNLYMCIIGLFIWITVFVFVFHVSCFHRKNSRAFTTKTIQIASISEKWKFQNKFHDSNHETEKMEEELKIRGVLKKNLFSNMFVSTQFLNVSKCIELESPGCSGFKGYEIYFQTRLTGIF